MRSRVLSDGSSSCPACGDAADVGTVLSSHLTLSGVVTYLRHSCGALLVLEGGHPVHAAR